MEKVIKIDGMKCMHCVSAVESALKETDGVLNVEVVLEDGIAKVEYDETSVNTDVLTEAIEDQGFDVIGID